MRKVKYDEIGEWYDKMKKDVRQTLFVAINNNECMYLDSIEEAMHYQEQGWVILQWKPLNLRRKIVFE